MDEGLELTAVTKLYRPRGGAPVRAIDRVSLSVPPGQVVGVLGPPGAGKSTLLGLAGGVIRPTYGRVENGAGGAVVLEEPGRRTALRDEMRPVLLTTRDVALAASRCDRVILLEQGRLVADVAAGRLAAFAEQEWYELQVEGGLDGARVPLWFDGFTAAGTYDGRTVLTGAVPDQAALHGLLKRVRDLGLPLVAVQRTDPDWGALRRALDSR